MLQTSTRSMAKQKQNVYYNVMQRSERLDKKKIDGHFTTNQFI